MFTGIITNLGKLTKKEGTVITFSTDKSFCVKLQNGTSVSINGVCLTIFKKPTISSFSVEIMPETENKTMLGYLKTNNLVNLELPLTTRTFLSGHIVYGHIDEVVKLLNIIKQGNSYILKCFVPSNLSRYIVKKGSVTINGVSLTVIKAGADFFTVGIIPYTWNNTMFHNLNIGDFVNIEVDILAKYIEKLIKND